MIIDIRTNGTYYPVTAQNVPDVDYNSAHIYDIYVHIHVHVYETAIRMMNRIKSSRGERGTLCHF